MDNIQKDSDLKVLDIIKAGRFGRELTLREREKQVDVSISCKTQLTLSKALKTLLETLGTF